LIASGGDYSGECCDTIANCPNAYDSSTTDTVASGWLASTVTFASVDLAVHACPMKEDVCKSVYRSGTFGTEWANTGGYWMGLLSDAAWTT
jgi:hypothetical protein